MEAINRSLFGLHFTVIILGGTALFSNIIPLPALDITLGRSLVALVFMLALLFSSKQNLKLNRQKDYLVACCLGGLMAAHWVTYFASMQMAGVSIGIIALFTFPVITVFLEPLFEKSKIRWQDLISALVVITGIALILPSSDLGNRTTLGIITGIASAVLYSLRNLIHRQHFSHYNGVKAMTWQVMIICLILLPVGGGHLVTFDTSSWQLLLLLGVVFTAIPHMLIAHSLIHLRAKTFSLIASMQPFYGVVLSILILGESPTAATLIGGLLIMSASIYETIATHKSSKNGDS